MIPGVTTKTFVPAAALFGKSLRAEVTGSRAAYVSLAVQSATSAPLTCSLVPPTRLAKTSVSKSRITVHWTRAACATKYVVTYRKASSSSRKSVVVGNVAQLAITGLSKGTKYKINIAAVRSDGVRSAVSPTVTIATAK